MTLVAAFALDVEPFDRLAAFVSAVAAARDAGHVLVAAAESAADGLHAEIAAVTWNERSATAERPRRGGGSFSAAIAFDGGAGSIQVVRSEAPFAASEHALLQSMADVLRIALARIDDRDRQQALLESLHERRDLLERLSAVQRSILHRAPIADVLDAICAGATHLLGDDVAALRLFDRDDPQALVQVASVGCRAGAAEVSRRCATDDGVGRRAAREARLVVEHEPAAATAGSFAGEGVRAAMAAPVFEAGRVVGSLSVGSRRSDRRYGEAECEVLQVFAEHASLALNDARTVEALRHTLADARHRASHDDLTGLVNRTVILRRLEQMLGSADLDGLVVLLVDLDRFKLVNDSLGHETGDRVLVATAERLQRCVREGDIVGRHSGDEFVVLCSGLHGEVDALGLADRICRELSQPVPGPSRDIVTTASVGVARATPGMTADDLLRDADLAMYQAKERGRGRVQLFGKSMRARLLERVELEHSLRRGLARDEFRLYYQPTVSLATGRPQMVEALVRWEHPDRGLVPPDAFIPVAEETGLIVPIGSWVLEEACREVAGWRRRSPALAGMQVAVNLSARQFADDDLLAVVGAALEQSGLDPSALWLEITESVVMDGGEATIRRLSDLKALGVRLSIDDFGTGYSSLSYLKRFPVDVLKIDRSFVDGLGTDREDEAIVTAVIRLAHALGKSVVAEGIENSVQLVGLSELGCETGQGYFFSRPQPPDAILAWLEERLSVPAR